MLSDAKCTCYAHTNYARCVMYFLIFKSALLSQLHRHSVNYDIVIFGNAPITIAITIAVNHHVLLLLLKFTPTSAEAQTSDKQAELIFIFHIIVLIVVSLNRSCSIYLFILWLG